MIDEFVGERNQVTGKFVQTILERGLERSFDVVEYPRHQDGPLIGLLSIEKTPCRKFIPLDCTENCNIIATCGDEVAIAPSGVNEAGLHLDCTGNCTVFISGAIPRPGRETIFPLLSFH